jgi:murein DD-endopeptidase MepM/ murein hydrolase activator NlpD
MGFKEFYIKYCCIVCALTLCLPAFAQYYPQGYFQSPMDTPLYLSAPFGSLRDNHFHSGMDIRTYEKEGLPVYAVADGYVSRIKYSPIGYGKALYIDHPNGYTSVYGHLQDAGGEIAAYIKKYQYEIEHFDFDHFPGRDKIKVKKGQIIGWSGNSGGSTGPHLHFEIRDTKTEEVINPQLFGVYGVDLYEPSIKKILAYNLEENRPVLLKEITINRNTTMVAFDSIYTYKDTLLLNGSTIGFGAEANDYLTNATTEYSIYSLELFIDGKKRHSYKLDRFSFDDSRCINVHIDYERYKEDKIRYQKCFKDDGNRIGIYNYVRNKGKFNMLDTAVHTAILNAYDFNGKVASVRLYFRRDAKNVLLPGKALNCFTSVFYPGRQNMYKTKEVEITIPGKALYDTLILCYKPIGKEKYAYSATHQVQDVNTPLNSSLTISIKPEGISEANKDKLLIGSLYPSGFLQSVGGGFENGWVTARTSTFGNFLIVADSTAPVIKTIGITLSGEVKDTSGIRFSIEDNFSGIASYKATINGKWILMEYDAKNNELIYRFDSNTIRSIPVKFALMVIDKKNNVANFQKDLLVPLK